MKKQTILKFLSLLWVSAFFISCDPGVDLSKLDTSMQIDQSLVVPIGEANVSIQDLLTQLKFDNALGTDPDSILFETNLEKSYSVPPMNLLKNAVTFKKSFPITVPFPLPFIPVDPNTDITPYIGSNEFPIDLGYNSNASERMDSVDVNLATLGITITDVSGIVNFATGAKIDPKDLIVKLIFPKIKQGGNILKVDVPTDKAFGQLINIDIPNFKMYTQSSIGLPMQIEFKTGVNKIKINSSANIGFELKMTALNFKVAYGKFAINGLSSNTLTIPLDMLSSIPKGLRFADPRATINVESNLGTKLKFHIDYVKAFSKNNTTPPVFAKFYNGFDSITETLSNRATYPGQIVFNTLKTLDKTNGQTYNLFDTSVQHDSLQYKFSVKSDPTDLQTMFFTPDMYMKANIKVQVPLQLQAGSSIEMKDTILIDGDKINLGSIDSCFLILDVINKLPARVAMIASFPDVNNQPIIPDITYYIEAPVLNSLGLVNFAQTFTPQNLKVKLSKDQTVKLKNAKRMIYTLRFIGEKNDSGTITPKLMYFEKKNSFNVKLGFYVKANTTLNL
ncbi:MAG: hypothetical protein WCG93_13300 [Paludibacter sp.]